MLCNHLDLKTTSCKIVVAYLPYEFYFTRIALSVQKLHALKETLVFHIFIVTFRARSQIPVFVLTGRGPGWPEALKLRWYVVFNIFHKISHIPIPIILIQLVCPMPMTKRFHCMKLVESIMVIISVLTDNLCYPGIPKKLIFCETSNQYLVANIITCLSDGCTL